MVMLVMDDEISVAKIAVLFVFLDVLVPLYYDILSKVVDLLLSSSF